MKTSGWQYFHGQWPLRNYSFITHSIRLQWRALWVNTNLQFRWTLQAGGAIVAESLRSHVSDTRDANGMEILSKSFVLGHQHQDLVVIIRVSEVIMFSPCVFVCLWLCLCLYHDVCPDNLTMKDWCHTNNILQVHCWGCLVVQVMFHALMTSSMTSPGHKVGQILKVIYLRQYLS